MYEVLLGLISQEENWTDSVHSHDNEHALAWATPMLFVWGNQLPHSSQFIVLNQAREHALLVHGFIHFMN